MSNLSKHNKLPDEFEKTYAIESKLIKKMTERDRFKRPNSNEIL